MGSSSICCCQSRREAIRNGEMCQDRWGKWHFPVDTIATAFRQPQVANRFHWTMCPFCNELLPTVNDAKVDFTEPGYPRPADSVGDGSGQADGGEGPET